jgi:hypothetical protein
MLPRLRKTAKGQAEIETRAHRLPPRQRSALIVVDGKRTLGDLRALIPQQPDETLQSLLDQGFIELVEAPAPETPAAASPPADAPPAPAADLPRLRTEASRALTQLVGPEGELLAIRIERARSLEELRPLLALAVQSVANMRGRQAAADFAARLGIG